MDEWQSCPTIDKRKFGRAFQDKRSFPDSYPRAKFSSSLNTYPSVHPLDLSSWSLSDGRLVIPDTLTKVPKPTCSFVYLRLYRSHCSTHFVRSSLTLRPIGIQIFKYRTSALRMVPGTVSGRTILPLEAIVSFVVLMRLMASHDLTM